MYRVKKDMPQYNLREGDQLYLDNFHKDHLEIFDKKDKFRTVLNLNGTENEIKAFHARNRGL